MLPQTGNCFAFSPRVISSDCAILRFDGQVMMIDSSTHSEKMNNRIRTACQTIGVDHIDIAYNSHPHNDHIDGFPRHQRADAHWEVHHHVSQRL